MSGEIEIERYTFLRHPERSKYHSMMFVWVASGTLSQNPTQGRAPPVGRDLRNLIGDIGNRSEILPSEEGTILRDGSTPQTTHRVVCSAQDDVSRFVLLRISICFSFILVGGASPSPTAIFIVCVCLCIKSRFGSRADGGLMWASAPTKRLLCLSDKPEFVYVSS